MSELFDIYDDGLNHIGVKPRAAVHRDGDWHQVFHCWVIGREADGEQFIILQKRADCKDTYPGKLDISAAGHLEAGESVRDGIREIEEELGLRPRFDELTPLGRRLGISAMDGIIDRQICHVFFLERNQELADYTYPADEITGLLKLRIKDGLRLCGGAAGRVMAAAVGFETAQVAITQADFIPNVDNYFAKVLILARRYFAGESHLWI